MIVEREDVRILNEALTQELLNVTDRPCLSLYMPTHRTHPDNLKDPIRYKNLLKKLEHSLAEKYASDEFGKLLEPFEALTEDRDFWEHTGLGLAIFRTNELFYIVKLNSRVEELAIVADSFHTKPLRKYLQSLFRFHVLGLTRSKIKFFEGNRYSLAEVSLVADVPTTIEEALGEELTEEHITVGSYGGISGHGESKDMRHGHGGKKDQIGIDEERFFRSVSKAIYEHYSKPTGLPLVVAALPEHHNLFQKVSKNQFLLPQSIGIDPTSVSLEKLTKLAWSVMEPEYMKRMEDLSNRFKEVEANGKGSADIEEVASALAQGKVDTLLIEEDRIISKRITDVKTGAVEEKDINNPEVDDLLDDMSELTSKMGGTVVVLPPDKMPSSTGVAALFRF